VTDVDVNATAAALLGLLIAGPLTGGQLVAAAGERFGAVFSVTRSQVYRELPVLAEAGLLRLGKQGPRSSQQYVITPAGRRAFKAWLAGPAGRAGAGGGAASSPDHLRSPLLLRLLHAGRLTPNQRSRLIHAGRQAYAQRLDAARAAAKTQDDPYAKAVADFVVAHTKAVQKLLDTVDNYPRSV
jgi:DNA-binding PadR family transcriptional regulator